MSQFSMPIQNGGYSYGRDASLDGPFLWEPTADDRRWALNNHSQTLERLKERGGMSWCEMVAIVGHRRWEKADQTAAKAECEAIRDARTAQPQEPV